MLPSLNTIPATYFSGPLRATIKSTARFISFCARFARLIASAIERPISHPPLAGGGLHHSEGVATSDILKKLRSMHWLDKTYREWIFLKPLFTAAHWCITRMPARLKTQCGWDPGLSVGWRHFSYNHMKWSYMVVFFFLACLSYEPVELIWQKISAIWLKQWLY